MDLFADGRHFSRHIVDMQYYINAMDHEIGLQRDLWCYLCCHLLSLSLLIRFTPAPR